jgi:hypothetical protein
MSDEKFIKGEINIGIKYNIPSKGINNNNRDTNAINISEKIIL